MVATAEKHDVAVIGGGPAGYATALYGAAAGLDIALVESGRVGGTCLHRGCIPAKQLLETATVFRTVAGAKEFGVLADQPSVDYPAAMARKQKVVDGLTKGLERLLKGRKVTVVPGTGTLEGPGRVQVSGEEQTTVEADAVVLAAGSAPRTLPGFDVDGDLVVTSDEVTQTIDELPGRVAIVGGGVIGCEFASYLGDLGAEVTVLEALPRILPGADEDCVKAVQRSFKKRGIDVRTGVSVDGHEPDGEGRTTLRFGDEELVVDRVIVAIGRRACSDTLGLDGTGVEVDDRGFVVVDERLRTGVDRVWAVGDLVATPHFGGGPHPMLAHVGFAEGIQVVKEILGENPVPIDYAGVPWVVYTHPELAFAGYTEQAARDAGFEVVTSTHRFGGNSRAMIVGETEGLAKVVAERLPDGSAGRILGVHLVGPWVTEQLGQGWLAVNWEATVDEVAHFVQPHPTLAELFGETVLSLTGRSLHG